MSTKSGVAERKQEPSFLLGFWPELSSLNFLSVLFSLVVTLVQVWQQWGLGHSLLRLVEYLSFNTFLFAFFSLTRFTFRLFTFFYFGTFCTLWCIKIRMGTDVGCEAVSALFEATFLEASSFLGKGLPALFIFALFLLALSIFAPLRSRTRSDWKGLFCMFAAGGLLLGVVALCNFPNFHKNGRLFQRVIPNNFAVETKDYLKLRYVYGLGGERKSITPLFDRSYVPKKLTVILIIGESARSDRFGINGYKRDTTPRLAKIKNLVSWPDTSSCSVSTAVSVPCLMVRQKREEFRFPLTEQSLISVMRDFGFSTHYFSAQNVATSPTILQICRESDDCWFDPNTPTDASLLRNYESALRRDAEPRRLFVLHQVGSHFKYASRYPPSFARFKPACPGSAVDCPREEIDNAYDNTILYTDFFVASVIESLQHQNAIVIYTSDHGEALGEFGRYGHGSIYALSLKVQKSVPFIVWFSESLIEDKRFRKRFLNLSKRSGMRISHDHFFYTALGCSGIHSINEGHDGSAALNLCR